MPNAPATAVPMQGDLATHRPTPPSPRGALTRDDVIDLGRAGAPERFLPIAAQALAQIPHDAGIRFLFAANLARLGLRTLAAEQLDSLPPEAGNAPEVGALRSALSGLPADRVDAADLARQCEANLAGLAQRVLPLLPLAGQWRALLDGRECFRRLDGGLVRRPIGEPDARRWTGLSADSTATHAAAAGLVRNEEPFTKPIVLAGLHSAAHLFAAWEVTARGAVGYTPRLSVVEPDPLAALDGLASADLGPLIADERVEWFLGPCAIERFHDAWRSRLGDTLPDSILATPGTTCAAAIGGGLRSLKEAQARSLDDLHAQVEIMYAGRDAAWWGRRFSEAQSAGPPLRVLVLTSRFTTYVRHAAADLAGAFERLGHKAAVSMEPDDHSLSSTVRTLGAVAELEPDLVVLVNYPRSSCGPGVPAAVPFVCWIQDAMPHLFAPLTDSGPLDFVAGHLFPELFERFGYRPENAMPVPVVADSVKFHAGPITASPQPACELALVSHHSEPPMDMHARLVREAAGAPAIQKVFETLLPDIRGAAQSCAEYPPMRALRDASRACVRRVLGREPEERTLALVLRTYAAPLADRFLRHQTLEWVAEMASRRDWRLRLYGHGWESHPAFARFAYGPLTHGEDLRAAFQSATVNLHVSITTLVHQRVLECFLSGGFCASRMQLDAIAGPKTTAQLALLGREPDVTDDAGDRIGYVVADHPEALHLASLRARMGYPLDEPVLWINRVRAESMRQQGHTLATDNDLDALTGDMAAVVFRTPADLESIVEHAIERPAWRAAVSASASRRISRTLTHEALAERLLKFLTRRLNGGAA